MIQAIKNTWNNKSKAAIAVKMLVFLILFFLMDFTIGKTFSYFYSKQISGWEYPVKYAIEDSKEELIIFGASRAQQQYKSLCFQDTLHLTCYNTGKDGMPILYQYGIMQSILKRHTPKMIIIDFENKEFIKDVYSYEALSSLLPFYKTHPELQPLLQLRSPYEKYKLLSYVYPYNSLIFKVIIGNTLLHDNGGKENQGYVPLTNIHNQPINSVNVAALYEIDTVKVSMFKSMIDDCKKRNIKLFIVFSPYYINQIGTDISFALGKEIAAKNNIDFIDYSKNELFLKSPYLFNDTVHLNTTGATLFSNMLASDIKKILTKQ